jgi:phenylpropionate dioxygenase-like ring-hydroxylating dioxygenase large terminal subunit
MLDDPVLVNDWHVVTYAPDLVEGKPMAVRLLEEDLVLWRVGDKIHAWRDLCVHLRSDRTAIAYRKWLRQLGLTFGTA